MVWLAQIQVQMHWYFQYLVFYPTADADDAAPQLQANKEFLKAETIAYINVTYPSLVYDSN